MDIWHAKAGPKRGRAQLDLPDLQQAIAKGTGREAYRQLLAGEHADQKPASNAVKLLSPAWLHQLRLGHSLLLVGYGDKEIALDAVAKQELKDGAVLTCNCCALGFTFRALLQKILSILRPSGTAFARGAWDASSLLQDVLEAVKNQRLYLVLHGIDDLAVQSKQGLESVAEMAAQPTISLLASTNHQNAALLWEKKLANRFRWVMYDHTTFKPLLSHRPPQMLGCRSVEIKRQGAAVVLRTLTNKAQQVFRLLAEHQLKPGGETGMTRDALFGQCRDRFLVKNELSFQSYLGEFKDHDMVQSRKCESAIEWLFIPYPNATITAILEELGMGKAEKS